MAAPGKAIDKSGTIAIIAPMIQLQCDWEQAFKIRNRDFWVSCKTPDKPLVSGVIKRTSDDVKSTDYLVANEGFSAKRKNNYAIEVEFFDAKVTSVCPLITFATIHDKSVQCLDVTENNLAVSVSTENDLKVWDLRSGDVRRVLEGHLWDIYTCRFFPSGIVVLSGSADMQIRIWSAETGDCAVTISGHTAAVTCTSIVDRGRNIISGSKDGTLRLWDCGTASELAVIYKPDISTDSVNCCDIAEITELAAFFDLKTEDQPEASEREVGTANKVLAVGFESGMIVVNAVRWRAIILSFNVESSVNALKFFKYDANSSFVAGCQDGSLHIFRVAKDTVAPVVTYRESASPVLCVMSGTKGFFTGRADGSCTRLPLDFKELSFERIALTGSNFDPIYAIASDYHRFVYTACRDGCVRKYDLLGLIDRI